MERPGRGIATPSLGMTESAGGPDGSASGSRSDQRDSSVVEELNDVLRREKFERYVRLEGRERFLNALIRDGILVGVTERLQLCRDPKDDKFLDVAVSGGASHIITGDDDLLILNPFRGIPIVTRCGGVGLGQAGKSRLEFVDFLFEYAEGVGHVG